MFNRIHRPRIFLLAIFFSLFLSPLTFGGEKHIVALQGIVTEVDWKEKTIVVNERLFFLNQNTIVYNEKGSQIPQGQLTTKRWVYIEGVKDKTQRKVAEKIYLLPKYIDQTERHLYPFIKE